jgi:transposase
MKKSSSPPATRREIGVDVSKDKLDVFDGTSHWQVTNDKPGIRRLIARLAKGGPLPQCRLTCESTGRYGHLMVAMALEAGLLVSIANPRAVRDFARCHGHLAKTDRIDSRVIAAFATSVNPLVLGADWRHRQHFVELHSRMRSLVALAASQKAALHQTRDRRILAEIRSTIAMLGRKVAGYEKEMESMVGASIELKVRMEKMTAIKGVGKRTGLALLAAMPELGSLNRQEAAALAGLAPMNWDSGTLRGKRRIQAGRAPARSALYMAAVVASRHHPTLKIFYQRLRAGSKTARQAFCAVARKLLIQINSALKSIQTPENRPIEI